MYVFNITVHCCLNRIVPIVTDMYTSRDEGSLFLTKFFMYVPIC